MFVDIFNNHFTATSKKKLYSIASGTQVLSMYIHVGLLWTNYRQPGFEPQPSSVCQHFVAYSSWPGRNTWTGISGRIHTMCNNI